YLRASVKELINRTRHDKNRPLLQTADPRARLEELYELRDPLYREVAHVTIDTGSQSLTTLMNRLHHVLEIRIDQPDTGYQPHCKP
ncbi:MAG: shikimate kinase, partial [Betaproteobacteria bacterium]